MMEEYTDICSLLGLEDIDIKPDNHWVSAGLNNKQTIIEETLCDPSELLDFLVSEQLREDYRTSYSNLLSSLNIDINLNINGRKYKVGPWLAIIQIIILSFQSCQTVIDLVQASPPDRRGRVTGLE